MSSMLRKINKKQNLNFSMSIKFLCPKCGNTKLIPQSTFQKINNETFKNNPIFLCDKCKIKMKPITVEVDY